jgi:hypothetical protein
MDIIVDNLAPDTDVILIMIGDNQVAMSISREEDGQVSVIITDNEEGSEMRLVLGQEGYTQKL